MLGACWEDGPDKLCLVLELCGGGSLCEFLDIDERGLDGVGSWESPRLEYALGIV